MASDLIGLTHFPWKNGTPVTSNATIIIYLHVFFTAGGAADTSVLLFSSTSQFAFNASTPSPSMAHFLIASFGLKLYGTIHAVADAASAGIDMLICKYVRADVRK